MDSVIPEELAIREVVRRWREIADDPDSMQEAMYGDVLAECADEIEKALDVRS